METCCADQRSNMTLRIIAPQASCWNYFVHIACHTVLKCLLKGICKGYVSMTCVFNKRKFKTQKGTRGSG